MNEIQEVVILAAGSSRRMGELTKDKPKCLLPYRGTPILERLIRQLKEIGLKKIVVTVGYQKERMIEWLQGIDNVELKIVVNDRYEEDVNIYSMHLALQQISHACVILEADTIMEDPLLLYTTGADFEGRSVWFTQGPFSQGQYGGILKSDAFGNVVDIAIVPEYHQKYADYRKLTGLMRVGPQELATFKRLVDVYVATSIKQYYLIPWIEHLNELPCLEGNAEHYLFKTFNQPEEYQKILEIEFDQNNPVDQKIELIDVNKLKHIEGYSEERVHWLMEKIKQENVWTKPLYIEKNHHLVLDGQHRLQVALRMGLDFVPVQAFAYEEVKVWTLRKEEEVNIPRVIQRANRGDIYPYKTVKHKFPHVINNCQIPLCNLKGDHKEEISR
ncbi:MAG: NTP transferase domain-containing protein [Anaerolineales bacterium]|nr:NTP transferase domain-containing protein [Anaerolineales bacterium]